MRLKHDLFSVTVIFLIVALDLVFSCFLIKSVTAKTLSASPVETKTQISIDKSDRVPACSDSDGKHPCPH